MPCLARDSDKGRFGVGAGKEEVTRCLTARDLEIDDAVANAIAADHLA